MNKPLLRNDRIMEAAQITELLEHCEYGVLSTADSQSLPYGTPLSYVYKEGAIYFHCANHGYKLDNLITNANVCFTLVGKTKPVFINSFTTLYESVIAFGQAVIISDKQERQEVLLALCQKYLPAHMDKAMGDIEKFDARTTVVKLTITHLTGKANVPPPAVSS